MHHQLVKPGIFELYYGAMKSGKTRSLLHRVEQLNYIKNAKYIVIQPKCNTRDTHLRSRSGIKELPTIVIDENNPKSILKHSEGALLVAIDEIQVFGKDIIAVILDLQRKNVNVVAAGLNLDFRGEPFGVMSEIMPLVDEPTALAGVCEYEDCNKPGTRTQRLVNGQPASKHDKTIIIEGKHEDITYETRCLTHFELRE